MTRHVRHWVLAAAAAAAAAGLPAGLTAEELPAGLVPLALGAVRLSPGLKAEDPPGIREYRDLKPSIDAVETVRLLSADKAAGLERRVAAAYRKLAPSVVRLWGVGPDGRAFDDKGYPQAGVASGVIIGKDGPILTCGHHGRPPKTPVLVELADGRRVNGTHLGWFEPATPGRGQPDLGLARIDGDGEWPAAAVGPAEPPAGGTVVLAIGYPGTLPPKSPPQLRLGWVLPPVPGYPWVQATTWYVAGDSGGPLFDLDGRVLGVMTGGEAFAGTHYEPVAAFLRHRDALTAGEEVSAPRPGVRARRSRVADFAAFVPALDLQDAAGDATAGVAVRVLDGTTPVAAGTLVDPAGWVVTKRTLVDGRSDLHCLMSTSATGRVKVRAKLVAADAGHDLALLRVEDGAGPQPDRLAWADGPPAVGRLVAALVPGTPLRFAVVGSGVRAEAPPAGDTASR